MKSETRAAIGGLIILILITAGNIWAGYARYQMMLKYPERMDYLLRMNPMHYSSTSLDAIEVKVYKRTRAT